MRESTITGSSSRDLTDDISGWDGRYSITINAPMTKIQSNAGIIVTQASWSKGERPRVSISRPCHLENRASRPVTGGPPDKLDAAPLGWSLQ